MSEYEQHSATGIALNHIFINEFDVQRDSRRRNIKLLDHRAQGPNYSINTLNSNSTHENRPSLDSHSRPPLLLDMENQKLCTAQIFAQHQQFYLSQP